MDFMSELVCLPVAEEYAVMRRMSEEVGVLQYGYLQGLYKNKIPSL